MEQLSIFFKSLIGYLKIPYEVKLAITIMSFISLIFPIFLSVSLKNQLNDILIIRDTYLPYVILCFLSFTVLTGADGLKNYKIFRNIKYRLKKLSPDEKRILQKYILQNTRSQKLDMNMGAVIALEQDNIIYRANIMTTDYDGDEIYFNFNIQVFVMEHLRKNLSLIGLTK